MKTQLSFKWKDFKELIQYAIGCKSTYITFLDIDADTKDYRELFFQGSERLNSDLAIDRYFNKYLPMRAASNDVLKEFQNLISIYSNKYCFKIHTVNMSYNVYNFMLDLDLLYPNQNE